jgi:hypothetical protein
MTECSRPDCKEKVHAKEMCRPHYLRTQLYDDPDYPVRDRGEYLLLRLQQIPATDLAYTAGLLDGEACITVEAPGIDRAGRHKAGRVRIVVYMITPGVLQWLKNTYGGCFNERKSRQPGQRPVHFWGLTGKSAGMLLEYLLPYMRVKNRQAEVAIAFYRAQMTRIVGQRLDPEYLAVLNGLKAEMLALNKRGVAA